MANQHQDDDIQVFENEPLTALAKAENELTIARIVGFDDVGRPLLIFGQIEKQNAMAALTTVALHQAHVGRQVAIMFVNQDQDQPIIIGLMKSQLDDLLDTMVPLEAELDQSAGALQKTVAEQNVLVDGKKITFEGQDEIVLKCGESSITLTKSGKILIRGKYLLNRASGVNRIMGGSVQVN